MSHIAEFDERSCELKRSCAKSGVSASAEPFLVLVVLCRRLLGDEVSDAGRMMLLFVPSTLVTDANS
jgi:hypothetical protein